MRKITMLEWLHTHRSLRGHLPDGRPVILVLDPATGSASLVPVEFVADADPPGGRPLWPEDDDVPD